ncbi:MAG: ATP-binding protein [Alistipes sp.]|nr:ATP-binding protein [Candidatus Alistipes equi]
MEFVDRTIEQEKLSKLLSTEQPGFAIIRGRRRVGKSTLIKRILTEQDIYFEADKTDVSTQMHRDYEQTANLNSLEIKVNDCLHLTELLYIRCLHI